jgi:hypothetical protein
MPNVDRSGIIELLGRLGADSDEAILAAARELNAKVGESGLSWDDLIRPQSDLTGADLGTEAADAPPAEEPVADEPAQGDGEVSAADKAEAARLIERLLARKNLSSTLREDLDAMKGAIADGSFDAMDSRYIRALAKRLGT